MNIDTDEPDTHCALCHELAELEPGLLRGVERGLCSECAADSEEE